MFAQFYLFILLLYREIVNGFQRSEQHCPIEPSVMFYVCAIQNIIPGLMQATGDLVGMTREVIFFSFYSFSYVSRAMHS